MNDRKGNGGGNTKERAVARPMLTNVSGGLNHWLREQRAEITKALPRMIDPDQFSRIALTTVKQDAYLMEADPISFITAVFEAAQAGLMIDGVLGHAYLVPFWSSKKNTRMVQLIPGYKGLIDMARRSGEISKVEARVVRAGDRFAYAYGIHQRLEHTPSDDDSDQWTHVYAIAWFKDPNVPPQFEVMTHRQVMAIRARSASVAKGHSSPWDSDEIPMAQKTAIRRLMRLLPLSIADQRIVSKDEAFDAGVRTAEFEVRQPVTNVSELSSAPDDDEDDTHSQTAQDAPGDDVTEELAGATDGEKSSHSEGEGASGDPSALFSALGRRGRQR